MLLPTRIVLLASPCFVLGACSGAAPEASAAAGDALSSMRGGQRPVPSTTPPEYDCDGDGQPECGDWLYAKGTCANEASCGWYYRSADLTLDQSCRCHPSEYDCDGDGQADCGVWSYPGGRCTNGEQCTYEYMYPDAHLGQSCRCRRVDYDCNGDGQAECGAWDYQRGMCKNRVYCGKTHRPSDISLGESCRCRRCNSPEYYGTAFADPLFRRPNASAFDIMSWGTFRVWADHLDTCAPWVMPKDDQALRNLLAYARSKGYKVRVSGAGHSAGGLVTDGADSRVVVVSLAEYTAPGEWEFGLRRLPGGSGRATVNAGWTQLQLYAKVRPLGFFPPAQTAGYFFQLGGIVANSVHGGGYQRGFIHSYVTRMRVMKYDGTIEVIDQEEDLRYWRNSFGLLGIILGVEFELETRDPLQMYSVKRRMNAWNAEEFWSFIKKDAEADIDPTTVAQGGTWGTRSSFSGEFFIDFVNGGNRPEVIVYAQKANQSVDVDFRGQLGLPARAVAEYAEIAARRVNDELHGRMTYGEAARRDGAPPIEVANVDVNDMLENLGGLWLARLMSEEAINNIPRLARQLSDRVNDGFFLTESPAALASAYFIRPELAFEAMDFLRLIQEASLRHEEFVWNLPGEFRFINVQDSAVLQPVPPGLWFNAQQISFAELAKTDQDWKRDFKKVEDYWAGYLGGKPHMAKLWGFATNAQGDIEPFSDKFACNIYSSEQKAAFSAYRARADPADLFATGLGMKVLAPCQA